jgi:hypothetical protein
MPSSAANSAAACLLVACGAAQQIMLAYWRFPPHQARRRIRPWLIAYGLGIPTLAALFTINARHLRPELHGRAGLPLLCHRILLG